MRPLFVLKESTRYPGLFVKKYTRKVFYDNLWNDELMEARGHVYDKDGKLVVNPFTKIFNRFENNTDIDRDEEVIAVRKVNGFMASATYVPQYDKVIVSTTGSLDSEFVDMAEEYITDQVKDVIKYLSDVVSTFMFEIVHPDDPHIIKEDFGAYLIGDRFVTSSHSYWSDSFWEQGLDLTAQKMGVKRPGWTKCRFSDVVEEAKKCKHEGFVVYGQKSKTVLKIKSPYYKFTKFMARMNSDKLMNYLDRNDWKQLVEDEEFYPIMQKLIDNKEQFMQYNEQERIKFIEENI